MIQAETNIDLIEDEDEHAAAVHEHYPPLKLPKTRDETLSLANSYGNMAEECRGYGSYATAQDFDLLAFMLRRRGRRMKP